MNEPRPAWIGEIEGILESMNQGVIINDASRRIVFANSLFLEMSGLRVDQILDHPVTDLFPPEDVPALITQIQQREIEGRNLFEFYLPQRGGGRLPVLVTSRQIKYRDGKVFAVVTVTDISAQKRAEMSLREANAQLEKRYREIEEELVLAARVQQSLAPSSLTWGGVSVETFYQPARTIGGDFGMVAPRADWLNLLVCDVSGHGISSALIANRIYTETMSQIEQGARLGSMMGHLNHFVIRNLGSSVFFFSLVAARLDRDLRTLEFAGAGHPPAIIIRQGESPQLLESRSAVLGLFNNAVDNETTLEVPVQAGDRVVIYTDGFTETFNSCGEMLGVDGFSEIVHDTASLPLPRMKQEIIDRVAAWRSGPAADDMSLVLFEINHTSSLT